MTLTNPQGRPLGNPLGRPLGHPQSLTPVSDPVLEIKNLSVDYGYDGDPVHVLRHFGSLAKTVETNVHTDIPLNRLPPLVKLVAGIEPKQTLTVTFSFDYFFGRQKSGNYPVPAIGRVRRTVRQAILSPELLERAGKAKTAKQSC